MLDLGIRGSIQLTSWLHTGGPDLYPLRTAQKVLQSSVRVFCGSGKGYTWDGWKTIQRLHTPDLISQQFGSSWFSNFGLEEDIVWFGTLGSDL